MRHDDPQLIEALAAEYVLGTLRGRARARFERWRAASQPIDAAIRAWEGRLVHMALATPSVRPPTSAWATIERRVRALEGRSRSGSHWRAIAAAVAFGILAGAGFFAWRVERESALQTYATIAQTSGAPLWRIEVSPDYRHLRAVTLGPYARGADRSLELWALPDGKAPVSLGLLPAQGGIERTLSAMQQSALRVASHVAVSLEPAGGSPTGAPTGAVLFVANRTVQT
jgi:anti-sigma-K factor RskA